MNRGIVNCNMELGKEKEKVKRRITALCIAIIIIFSLSACNSKTSGEVKDVSLEEIHTAVKEAYGDSYIPSETYDAASIEEFFGVSQDWYEEAIAEGPMISMHVDKFVAIKAKPDNVEQVKKALVNYRQTLIDDTMQYPINIGKIQGSKVVQYDNYLFFLLLGEIPMEAEEQGQEAIIKEAEAQNQIAIDVIETLLK